MISKLSQQDKHIIEAYIKAVLVGLSNKDKIAYYRGLLNTVGVKLNWMDTPDKKTRIAPGYGIAFQELTKYLLMSDDANGKKRVNAEWRKLEKDVGTKISLCTAANWRQ